MRPRIFSLLLVLSTILIAPAIITSCEQANAAQKQHVYLACATNTAAAAVLVTMQETATPTTTETEYQAQTVTPTDQAGDVGSLITGSDGFGWQNITILILGILSTFFAVLWKRAKMVIQEINESLKDGKIDKAELQRIIAAWKG